MWLFNTKARDAVRAPGWAALLKKHVEKQPCCQACGSCKKPEVHHIVPVHLDPSKELDEDNLITLCDKWCHFIFGHLMNYKSWNEDVIKDCENYLDKIKNKPYK